MNVFDILREKLNEHREDFMFDIYKEFENDSDNLRANGIIDNYDEIFNIVNQVEKEYQQYIENYTGKGTFTAREIRLRELEAIEKQIAMKPCNKDGLYHCPKCKMPIFASTNYCSDCGKKLKWD